MFSSPPNHSQFLHIHPPRCSSFFFNLSAQNELQSPSPGLTNSDKAAGGWLVPVACPFLPHTDCKLCLLPMEVLAPAQPGLLCNPQTFPRDCSLGTGLPPHTCITFCTCRLIASRQTLIAPTYWLPQGSTLHLLLLTSLFLFTSNFFKLPGPFWIQKGRKPNTYHPKSCLICPSILATNPWHHLTEWVLKKFCSYSTTISFWPFFPSLLITVFEIMSNANSCRFFPTCNMCYHFVKWFYIGLAHFVLDRFIMDATDFLVFLGVPTKIPFNCFRYIYIYIFFVSKKKKWS